MAVRPELRAAVAGCLAGSLFGLLIREFGIWSIAGVDHLALLATVSFAVVAAALSARWRALLAVTFAIDMVLLAVLWVVALTPIMSTLMRPLVRRDSIPAGGVDAVVVLSADVTSGGTLSDVGTDRLLAGLDLMRRGVAPRLFTTRIAYSRHGAELTTDADQERLISIAGITDRWTLLRDHVSNTHDEALVAERELGQFGGRSVALVTSPWHTRRACATFEVVGMRVTCVPALERGPQTVAPKSAADRLAAFRYFLYERAAWVEYWWRHWVPRS